MIATYQDMVSNKTFENLIKNVISVITKLGELVNSIGLAKIVFIAFSAIMYKLGSLVLPIVTKQLIAFGTSFLLITDNIAMFPSMIKNISFALMSGGGLTGALTAAETALLSFGSMLGGLAIAAAVVGITYAVMNYKTAAEKAKESIEEFADAEREHKQTSEDLSAQLDENIAKYEELAKVKSLGNISDRQQEEMNNLEQTNELLKKQIAYENTLADLAGRDKEEAAKKALETAMFDTGIEDNARNNAITGKAGMSSNTRKVNIENMGAEVKATAEEYAELIAEAYQKGDEKAVETLKAEAKAYQGKVAEFGYSEYVESLDKTGDKYKELMANTEDVNYGLNMLDVVLGSSGLSMEEYTIATDEATLATDELANATENFDTMATIFSTATEAMSQLKSAQDELSESNTLSWGTVQGLIDSYPALKSKLYGYMQGVVSNTEMVDLLTKAYSDQETTMENNLESSEDYYSTMISGNTEMYNRFLENYNIDLSNFSSLTELKEYLQEQLTINTSAEEAKRIDLMAEGYNIDLSNFAGVVEKKLQMQKVLLQMMEKTRATEANVGAHGGYVPAGTGSSSLQREINSLGITSIDSSIIDELIGNVKNLAGGISAKSLSESASDSSASGPEATWTDITQAIIDAANQQSIFDKKQSEILESQIQQAENAEDYVKQIELQNKLLENQKKTIADLQVANQKIHEQANEVRKTTSYNTDSWFNADNTDSKAYIDLLNSFAGKTDDVSKKSVESIKSIHDQLKLLKEGWTENQDAIIELEQTMSEVSKTMEDIAQKAVDSVNSVLDEIVDLYKKQYDEEMDDLEELYDKKKDLADKEYEEDKERLDKKLENFQDYIQEQKDALNDQYDEDTFNSDLAEKQEELAEIQAQINELALAVGSGDRVALSKSEDLMEELADKQKEIDDLISERSKTLQEDALDDSLSDYEDYIDSKQDILDEEYNEQLEDIESWYNKKKEKLEKNYSDEELYSKARRMLINGEYEELQTLYTTYMDDQSEGWLQLGDILEDSFVAKLREAAELLAELEEGGISTSRLIKAISDDSGSSSGGSSSGKSHTTLGGGFAKMTTDDWETYKQNKKDYENGKRMQATAQENAAIRKKYGIANDNYSYSDIKNYYDSGGEAYGKGLLAKNVIEPERVLSAEQTEAFNKLVSTLPTTLSVMSNITSGIRSYASPSTVVSGSSETSSIHIDSLVKIEGDVVEQSKVKQMEDIAKSAISELANKINSSKTTYNKKFSLV